MLWDLYGISLFACKYIVATVVLIVEILGSDHCSHLRISVKNTQFLSFGVLVVVKIHYVVSRTTLVFLASLVLLNSSCDSIDILDFYVLHIVPPLLLFLETFLSQISPTVQLLVVFAFSYSLVCYCEVFIKTLSLYLTTVRLSQECLPPTKWVEMGSGL